MRIGILNELIVCVYSVQIEKPNKYRRYRALGRTWGHILEDVSSLRHDYHYLQVVCPSAQAQATGDLISFDQVATVLILAI